MVLALVTSTLALVAGSAPAQAETTQVVYVTEAGLDRVAVMDAATGTVVATADVQDSPYGVAVSPDGSRVYVPNAGSDTVSVIETVTNTVVATVAVGDFPVGVAVTPDGTQVYWPIASSERDRCRSSTPPPTRSSPP
ncbi:hypothetical protein BH18ACT4_BH18ACT4_02730 [soil metagenome]